MLRWPFLTCAVLLRRNSGVMCAVCGWKSIIHRHMHSSLWNLSIIDSASPTVGMVRGLSSSITHYWACVRVGACEHLGVYAHVKKRLERGWRKTHNGRKEHGAVQCKVQSLSLSPSLFFKYFPHGFLRETKELYSPLSLTHLLSSLPPFLLYFSGCISVIFYYFTLPPCLPLFSLSPGCFAL